jgi:hypothetical protein
MAAFHVGRITEEAEGNYKNVVTHFCPNVTGSLNLQRYTQDILIKLMFHRKT